jgi:2-desacetyl-2-hydroxyethyl bacteriochlorophyllide A dehydrogenase
LRTDEPSRELWFEAPRIVRVRAGDAPALAPDRVVARAFASGISQGTELLLYRGEGPASFDPSLDRVGAPTYPRRYGYAWVGEVVACGADVQGLVLGDHVFALASHGDLHALPATSVFRIDPAIPSTRAVLAASLETAITCVWDAGISLGDEVVVLGAGAVGLLAAWLATCAGANVRVIERSARRRALARTLDIRDAIAPSEDRPRGEADVVIEATGDPAALDHAIAHAAREATVALASFYGARTHPVTLGGEFHRRRLILRSTQVSSIPPLRAPRWTPARRFEIVRRLLRDERLDALLEPSVPFDEAPAAYARLDEKPGDHAQMVFAYR